VLTLNVALVAPAAKFTVDGADAPATLLVMVTLRPPLGAGPLSTTVPVAFAWPPTTEMGAIESLLMVTGLTVADAVLMVAPWVAVMVTGLEAVTGDVLTKNVALVAPGGTVTVLGTRNKLLSLVERLTPVPPVGAGPVSFTAPLADVPPRIDEGLTLTDDNATGDSATMTERVAPLNVAVSVTEVEVVTEPV